jgi:hypothetical protein
MADQTEQQDPTDQYQQPDNTDEQQAHPGLTERMQDKPDHGEDSYRGSDRLTDRRAVITGGDSGIGRAVALALYLAMQRRGATSSTGFLMVDPAPSDWEVEVSTDQPS